MEFQLNKVARTELSAASPLLVAAQAELRLQLKEGVGDWLIIERIVLEILVGEFLEQSVSGFKSEWVSSTYLARKTHEQPILIHHIRSFFILIRLPISIGSAGREKGCTVQWAVAMQGVDDLVARCGAESFFI